MAHLGKHAIVIGASVGGLLAARALADYYDEVTVLERDDLPDANEPRKGVPQGRHAHGLLARGREVLEQLFPGFSEEMVGQGAMFGDVVDEVLWFNHGVYLNNVPSGLQGLLISRPMLENGVRRRVLQLPNVRLRLQSDAQPAFDRAGSRVTGVRVDARDGSDAAAEQLAADLVVILRSQGLVVALNSAVWEKYKIGESFKIIDPETKAPAVKNPFVNPKPRVLLTDDMAVDRLLGKGAVLGACNVALHGLSKRLASNAGVSADDAAKEWAANLVPGITLLPSGVWGLNRAQEAGCTYCTGG